MKEIMLIAALVVATAIVGCQNMSCRPEALPAGDALVLEPNQAIVQSAPSAEAQGFQNG